MNVTCENCQSTFRLDESRLNAEGAWVRCSKCQDVFQVFPPAPEAPASAHGQEPVLDVSKPAASGDGPAADFGLDTGPDQADRTKPAAGPGKKFKVLFWAVASIVLLLVLLLVSLVTLDRLGAATGLVDVFRGAPGFSLLLGKGHGAKQPPAKLYDTAGLSLTQVRGYFRISQQAGRLFIVQGLVENQNPQQRANVLVRGRLNDDKGAVVRQAEVYAGTVFNPDELRQMSLADMQSKLSQPSGPDGARFLLGPGGTLPFMIVFSSLPDNLSHFTAEVLGAETAPASGQPAH